MSAVARAHTSDISLNSAGCLILQTSFPTVQVASDFRHQSRQRRLPHTSDTSPDNAGCLILQTPVLTVQVASYFRHQSQQCRLPHTSDTSPNSTGPSLIGHLASVDVKQHESKQHRLPHTSDISPDSAGCLILQTPVQTAQVASYFRHQSGQRRLPHTSDISPDSAGCLSFVSVLGNCIVYCRSQLLLTGLAKFLTIFANCVHNTVFMRRCVYNPCTLPGSITYF